MTPPPLPRALDEDLEAVREVAGFLWERGWAERNAGNCSLDVTDRLGQVPAPAEGADLLPLASDCRVLAGRVLLMKATGSRFREVARRPAENMVLLRVGAKGTDACLVAAGRPGASPTSELPAHLRLHARLRAAGRPEKAVLHTHPTDLVALSHVPNLASPEAFDRALASMHPEIRVVLPDGVAFAPYRLPGSEALAEVTADALEKRRLVVWEKHGAVASGRDIREAFDLVDTANKGAAIWLRCHGAGVEPAGLTAEQIAELEARFGGGGPA